MNNTIHTPETQRTLWKRGRKNVRPEDIVKDSEILSSGDNTDLATTCSQRL